MHLQNLSVINFKNHENGDYQFSEGVNCFVGNNGTGKTNLLDAIHYLSFTKSYFNSIDNQNIKHHQDFFLVQGNFLKDDEEFFVHCGQKQQQKKIFKKNKKEYSRLSEHIGLFPSIIISPSDTSLITGLSELRRKFLDSVISQADKNYLTTLIKYNRVLAQRNALLKSFNKKGGYNYESLQIWNDQLIETGNLIHHDRLKFLGKFNPIFQKYYSFLSQQKEKIEVNYHSQLSEDTFSNLLHINLEKDRAIEYTTIGIHKDDLEFLINGYPIKKVGSQGQQKSFLVALKLAQFDFIRNNSNIKPILLLDDIFDKLDDNRVSQLMQLVSEDNFGQIFITDTHPKRIADIFNNLNIEIKLFNLNVL